MNISITRRRVLVAGGLLSAGLGIAQPAFPSKPIRLIVPFPPGGSTTVVARLLGQRLTERWGQPVVVENRPGGNGVIASEELLRAPADGHTILLVVNTHAINPLMMATMPYDTNRDFAPVSTLYRLDLMVVAHPSVPASNLREFIAVAKARPESFNFAAGDNAGLTHLAAETFNSMAGTKLRVIPYKGTGPALSDTIAGHVQAYFSSASSALPHLKAGKLKGFAISGNARQSALPELPTFAEAGLPGFEAGTWAGIITSASVPRDVVNKLSAEIGAVMNMPDIKEMLIAQGLSSYVTTPDQFAAIIRSDTVRFERILKAANIKMEK